MAHNEKTPLDFLIELLLENEANPQDISLSESQNFDSVPSIRENITIDRDLSLSVADKFPRVEENLDHDYNPLLSSNIDNNLSNVDDNANLYRNLHVSPIRNRQRRVTISSSEVKRNRLKESHCNYCNLQIDKEDVEFHLLESNICSQFYLKQYRCQSIDSVLLKLFPCLFCSISKTVKMKIHLTQKDECFQKYCNKWNVSSVR